MTNGKLVCIGISLLLANPVMAASFQVRGPCSATPWAEQPDFPVASGTSAGAATVAFLEAAGLEYLGTDQGITSIEGTPYGDTALEIIDDDTMRSYGWCYTVDGVAPDIFPGAFTLQGDETVYWYFGYALYDQGAWVDGCHPAFRERPAFLCPER